jgi:hypothetical protein
MPKLPDAAKNELREAMRMQGLTDKFIDNYFRGIESDGETQQNQQILEMLKEQGRKFSKAEILEFLGSDGNEIPPEFNELLTDGGN